MYTLGSIMFQRKKAFINFPLLNFVHGLLDFQNRHKIYFVKNHSRIIDTNIRVQTIEKFLYTWSSETLMAIRLEQKSQILMWYGSGGHIEYWICTKITNSDVVWLWWS